MSTDLGTIGYGTSLAQRSANGNSYPANEQRAGGTGVGSFGGNPTNPYINKPNGYMRQFVIQDVAGGSAVAGSKAYLREHYSQELVGSIKTANSSGGVTFRNLDSAAVYTVIFIHPSSSTYNAAIADWIVPNPGV